MPGPVVVIEMPADARASPLADALVRTCSASVADGRCVLASDREEPDATAVAIVRWVDPDERIAEVSVGLRAPENARWMSRRVEFHRTDDARERWRAVGLVIATLVGESHRAAEESPQPPPPAPPPPPTRIDTASERARPPAPSSPRAREIGWIDGGAALDPGFGGWLHAGGWLRGSLRPSSLPAFVLVAGRYAAAPTDRNLSQQWAEVSAGVGGFAPIGALPLRVEFHVGAVAQLLHAHASDPTTGASDASSRWIVGARLASELAWNASASWALVGALEVNVFASRTNVRVEGQPRGTDPTAGVGALVGARALFR
jgi:hypothetical protein